MNTGKKSTSMRKLFRSIKKNEVFGSAGISALLIFCLWNEVSDVAGVQNGGKHLTALIKIPTFLQVYVQAVSSIFESVVTVVDSELIRVAGTGDYGEEIGRTVADGNFFCRIFPSGAIGIIT